MEYRANRVQKLLDDISDNPLTRERRDIVAFIGPCETEIRSLIRFLSDWKINSSPGKPISIRNYEEPGTRIPEGFFAFPLTNWVMLDFSILESYDGTELEIATAAAYEKILKHQKTIRYVMVVPFDLIESRDPMPFIKLINNTNLFCGNNPKSLSLIISSYSTDALPPFSNVLSKRFDIINDEAKVIFQKNTGTIRNLIKWRQWAYFRLSKWERGSYLNDGSCIIDAISRSCGNGERIAPCISRSAKGHLLEVYSWFFYKAKEEVELTCSNFITVIRRKISQEANDQNISSFAIFKKKRDTILNSDGLLPTEDGWLYLGTEFETDTFFFNMARDEGIWLNGLHVFHFLEELRNTYEPYLYNLDFQQVEEFSCMFRLTLFQSSMIYSEFIRASPEYKYRKSNEQYSVHNEKQKQRCLEEELDRVSRRNEALLDSVTK